MQKSHSHMMRPPIVRFLMLIRPHVGKLALGMALVFLSSLLTLPAPWILKIIIDEALPDGNLHQLAVLLAVFSGIFILRGIFTLLRNRILQFASMRIVCDMRIALFSHLQSLSLRYFDSHQSARVTSRITQDTNELYNLVNGFLINIITDSLTVFGVLGFLFWVEWRLALCVSLILPLFAVNYLYNRRRMREESRVHRDNWDRAVGFLQERVAAMRVVKSFAREAAESESFASGMNADYFNYSRIVMRNTRLSIVADLLGSLGALVVLGYGGWLVIQGRMQVGTLVAFNGYITFVFPPIVRFVDLAAVMQRAGTGLENIFTLLDTKPEIQDAPGAVALPPVAGRVEFRHVFFDYDREPRGRGHPRTLGDVNFSVPAGKMAAIVGPSGSGKSTIINLLARFYDVASGEILIDGIDIRNVTMTSLRRQIGIVLQENMLFSGTIEENIKYARPSAGREDTLAAARAANAHEFIIKMPDGYATMLGERGARLSGGQRQRIAIARAIVKDPRILIFDEATSALDSVSECLIQDAMVQLMKGRTTFVIAHRLSTIQRADIILVMDGGRIVETGRHDELIHKNGLYSRLHALQFREPA